MSSVGEEYPREQARSIPWRLPTPITEDLLL